MHSLSTYNAAWSRTKYEPFDGDGCTFLTISRHATPTAGGRSALHGREGGSAGDPLAVRERGPEDTGEITRPRRRPNREAAREKFGRGEDVATR